MILIIFKKLIVAFGVFFLAGAANAQTIAGFVTDSESGEPLIGATVFIKENHKGTATNVYGYFSLSVHHGQEMVCSYVGYNSETILCDFKTDTLITIHLKSNNELDEVVVQSETYERQLAAPEMGINKLNARQIQRMPVILGESDVLKAVQMLPGVNAGNEGMSGISVRGGSPDHTLILLDGVPVYNVNHLFGYFSVFNSQAIHDVNLIKGAIPARYGGRLTSVLDIRMKEGDKSKHRQQLNIGTLAVSGIAEGPLWQGKGSYMISGRRTWFDLPLRLYFMIDDASSRLGYYFQDINGKINYQFSSKDRVYLSFYSGDDQYYMSSEQHDSDAKYKYGFSWGNSTGSFRWNHLFSQRLFMNMTLYNSYYAYTKKTESLPNEESDDFGYLERYRSNLNDVALKADFDYGLSTAHHIKFGADLSYKYFHPDGINLSSNDSLSVKNVGKSGGAYISNFYFEDAMVLGEKFQANVGLRSSMILIDNELKPYLLPRCSFAWNPIRTISFKAGYSHLVQHVHQLTNASMALPTDFWIVASNNVKSSKSNLFSLGAYFQPNSMLNFSVEGFYSKLNDVISYYPGLDFTNLDKDHDYTDIIMQGKGKAYGVEVMAEKKIGNLTGFVNYTWSRSLRKYDELGGFGYYPYDYDRPHKVAVLLNYTFRTKLEAKYKKSISSTFTFSSGRNLSLATAVYSFVAPSGIILEDNWLNKKVYYTPGPNNIRMSNFHHMDVSFHLDPASNQKGAWTLGVYNIYNHFNTSHYAVLDDKIMEVAIFPIMPFVSWKKDF
ncbi:MAG: carboxypeptidase-like regulatory domain-containing protein [Prolixibacteraceae bacterium]